MKHTLIFSGILILLLQGSSCAKKPFSHLKVYGRILNFFSKEPLSTEVSLIANYGTFGGSIDKYLVASVVSDKEGYFTLEGKAYRRSSYSIQMNTSGIYQLTDISFNKSNTLDLGTLYRGEHVIYSKTNFVPDSGRCLELGYPATILPSNTYTTIISKIYTYWDNHDSIWIRYKTNNCNSSWGDPQTHTFNFKIPITGNDTVYYMAKY